MPRVIRILFLLALPLAVYSSGSAAALQGKVAEVVDGESIAIISQNHPVKIKLIGVAAPEKNQSYAGVARQHLSDLILNKDVVVRFSSLRDGYLVGQVLLGEMDIGAQMIRDGVGWYNKSDASNLTELERQVYQGSQDAARSERRGLWQDESPLAPWDFREAQRVQQTKPNPNPVSTLAQPTRVTKTNRAGLSSEDLMGGMIQPGSIAGSMAGQPDVKQLSTDGAQGRWLRYQPEDRHFSILAPSDGIEVSYKVLAPEGQLRDVHYIMGADVRSKTVYLVNWAKGPSDNSTSDSSEVDAIKGFLAEVNRVRERLGEVLMTATPGRRLTLTGYEGREYALAIGPASGVIRIYSKQIGDARELFLLGVITTPGTTVSGDEFLNSFKIVSKQ